MKLQRVKSHALLYIVLICTAIIQITPLCAAFLNSFRTDKDIKTFPIGFPSQLNFQNYIKAWNIGGYFKAFANSITISFVSTIVVILFSIICGYFLARSSIKLKNFFIAYLGISLSIPVFSYIIPLYFTFAELNLVNTKTGIILIFIATNLPFNVLLARTFILGIPKELDEAASIDGCSTYQMIWKIIIPIAKPIITTIALIVFVATWNEFTIANLFLQSPELKTASTRYVLFVGERGSDLSMIYTAGVLTMLPIIILFIALQNYFIEGLTTGSVK